MNTFTAPPKEIPGTRHVFNRRILSGHHVGAGRISLRLRHRRHLRRGAEDSIALGTQPRHARIGDGLGALRHGAGLAAGRLADGSVRPQAHVAVHRRALRHLGGRLRLCQRGGHVHRRALHRRHRASASRPWPRRSTSPKLRRRPIAGGWRACSSSTSSSALSSPFSPTRSLAGIGENAWRWMLGVAAFPSAHLRRDVLRPAGKPALVDRPQGRPRGGH